MFPRKSPKAFREPVSQDGQFGLFERPKVDFGRLAKQCPNLDVNLPQKKDWMWMWVFKWHHRAQCQRKTFFSVSQQEGT